MSAVRRPEASEALIRLSKATVRYPAVTALSSVDLTIGRGEFVGVLGANGSGKTTLLHVLHGLVAASGTREVAAGAVRQAMVFQRPFMLRLSVRNNLRIALRLAGVARDERADRIALALRRAGLEAFAARPARALSIGQQQRLALARAWAVRPDVLFLDEPTSNLDPPAKNDVEAMLAGFAAEGMTLVMSTHNLGQAKRLAGRVVYLDGGVVRADLPTARFFGEVVDERTGAFLKGDSTWRDL